jgi:hypothetical protein
MHARRNFGEFAWLLLQDFQFTNAKLVLSQKQRKSAGRTSGGNISATVLRLWDDTA